MEAVLRNLSVENLLLEPASSAVSGDTETGANELRRLIDQKIADLFEEIRRLKFSTLDLTGMIVGGFSLPSSINFPKLFNFTYVSKKWRSVALQTPDIWGTIPCVDAKWASLMLERSKMVDLVLGASLSTFPLSAIKGMLDNHSSRIRKFLFIRVTESAIPELVKDVQVSSLRQLRSLYLAAAPSSHSHFPSNILGELRGLQHLYLLRFDFWPSAFPSSLVGLTMIDIHRDYRPSLSAFIAALQSIPALETLRLADSLPLALDVVKSDTVVVLRNLRNLRLSSETACHEISNVLPLLVVPQTTSVYLSCEVGLSSQVSSSPLSDLASSLSTFFLSLISGSDEKVTYKFVSSFSAEVSLSAWKDEDDGTFGLDVYHESYPRSQMLPDLFPSLPFLDVQALTVFNSAGSLAKTFGKLPKLRHLTIGADRSIGTIVDDMMFEPQSHDPYVSFPALESICLRSVSLCCTVDERARPIGIDPDKLIDLVRKRCASGCRLQKLTLNSCYVNEVVVERLREVVDVEWDGIEAKNCFDI